MGVFNFEEVNAIGQVTAVDTSTVTVHVSDTELLNSVQVNHLVALQSSRPGEFLIGLVQKIVRKMGDNIDEKNEEESETVHADEINFVRIALIGTLIDVSGEEKNVFRRTLNTVPEIDASCFPIEEKNLTNFMGVLSTTDKDGNRLSLGTFTLDENAPAYLNGNKFFQRHAIIVGSTGSGKSWTTAHLLNQVACLNNSNAIIFDIHGEYEPLTSCEGISGYKIAGSSDLSKGLNDRIIFLPYWLLEYEAITSIFVERGDQNAPNQTMLISQSILEAKKAYLETGNHTEILDNFTIDSPVPFKINDILEKLKFYNEQRIDNRQGPHFGKLSRLMARLDNKVSDRRLGFMFRGGEETMKFDWLEKLSFTLFAGNLEQTSKKRGGVKVIDFSEVPSDILPLIVSLVARLAFSLQQWIPTKNRHPIALFCDEAHLYIPEYRQNDSAGNHSVAIFERIAKEGRKYGVGLVVTSQRPSEVNRTVLSQCNNVVAMRLTNADDQGVVKRLLPDSLGGFSELLPILDIGEALVVGDASILPSRIRVTEPTTKPNSGTINFWTEWAENTTVDQIPSAVKAWRKQTLQENTFDVDSVI